MNDLPRQEGVSNMFVSHWFSPWIQGWPFWLVLIGLLVTVIYRFSRDKADLERPADWDREI